MKTMTLARWMCAIGLPIVLAGCSQDTDGFSYQPASGSVLLDGTPLPNAEVTFVPVGSGLKVGRASVGTTDDEGHFELTSIDGIEGAVVGQHAVAITTGQVHQGTGEVLAKETLPPRYNKDSILTYEVPSQGTSDIVFELQSK